MRKGPGYAVVTGAGGAIGGSLARACAAAGYDLCTVSRDEASVAGLAAEHGAHVITGDLADHGDVDRLAEALRELDGVTLLVHAAGSFHAGAVADVTLDMFDSLFGVNVRAAHALTRALLPSLRATQGQIVFLNSSAGVNPGRRDNGAYAASKHALRALADAVRDEVNDDGVRVLSVYPGRTASCLQQRLHAAEGRRYVHELLLQPEDVAAVIMAALELPRTAEATDIHVRPMRRAEA